MVATDALVKFTCFAVLSEVVYHVFNLIYVKLKSKKRIPRDDLTASLIETMTARNKTIQEKHAFHKVLFFPDSGVPCKREQAGRKCRNANCSYSHGESSFGCLIQILHLAKKSLDVCVYMITSCALGDLLVECQQKGLIVRVITDEKNSGEDGEIIGAQIGKLRAAGTWNVRTLHRDYSLDVLTQEFQRYNLDILGLQETRWTGKGILVHCSTSSFWMHHKFAVMDNEILVNGSFNWTTQAVMGNYENLLITSEQELVKPFVEEFQRLWKLLDPSRISFNKDIN